MSSTDLRKTQRAPRSCSRCAMKRIRCDKQIPCNQCISRGIQGECRRETVVVKGRVATDSRSPGPTYGELLEENRRLRASLATNLPANFQDLQLGNLGKQYESSTTVEAFEKRLFDNIASDGRTSSISHVADIVWPSQKCSTFLLSHAEKWTSMIHCALHIPTFNAEHRAFWDRYPDPGSFCEEEPLWLAVYFSSLSAVLLFMEAKEVQNAMLPNEKMDFRIWYDAALFYLHKGDFLRRHNILTVQAIAILGIVFNNAGDSVLQGILLSCAIRIAQNLRLDSDKARASDNFIQTQVRRRLWWTLVICEWLAIPQREPCVCLQDFEVELPAVLDDSDFTATGVLDSSYSARPRQIQYHIAMIKIAQLYHEFRSSVKSRQRHMVDISSIVLAADENLAMLIGELPMHLQENSSHAAHPDEDWIDWQRQGLFLVLFHYRMAVHRVLQQHWIQNPSAFARAQAICLGSAQDIISLLTGQYLTSAARNRPWSTSVHLFSAATTLIAEARHETDKETVTEYLGGVRSCLAFLQLIKDQSAVASRAIEILEEELQHQI